MSARLSDGDVRAAAEEFGVDVAALKAVADVESSGVGFLPDGRLKILFEGHVFWRQLAARNIDPEPVGRRHPTVCYPRWTRRYYLGGALEYSRLAEASTVHREAAYESTSWGLFQLMGFNHRAAGYGTVFEMVGKFGERGEREQLWAICRWMQGNGLLRRLAERDWEGFARGYNGPGQVAEFSARLRAAYQRRVDEARRGEERLRADRVVYVGEARVDADDVLVRDGVTFVRLRVLERLRGVRVVWDAENRVAKVVQA